MKEIERGVPKGTGVKSLLNRSLQCFENAEKKDKFSKTTRAFSEFPEVDSIIDKDIDVRVAKRFKKVNRMLTSFEKERESKIQRRKDMMVLGKRSDHFDQKLKEFSNFVINHR